MLNLILSFIRLFSYSIKCFSVSVSVSVYLEFFFFFLGNWAISRKKYSSR